MPTRALPFSRHALILGVLTLAIYLVFALLSYQQYQDARQQLRDSDLKAAHAELRGTVRKAMADLLAGVDELSQWGELYQQLQNPTYFVYWYSHRIRGAGGLDSRFSDLMIYDLNGEPLSVFDNSTMPESVTTGADRERYEIVDGDVRVTLIIPLRRDGEDKVQGHLAVQAFLLPSIKRLHAFNLVDAGTLAFSSPDALEGAQSITAAARFELLPTRHFALVDGLVGDVVVTLGLLVALPSLVLVIYFTLFVGRAVQRVPAVIDLLRDGGKVEADEIGRRLDDILPGPKISELCSAERSLVDYHNELSSANTVLDEKNQELWLMAHQDALTSTSNRRAFDDYWETLQDLNQRSTQPPSLRLMLCDINHFKAINDTYGHQVGDAVLAGVATCLHQALRASESLFRLGGDEFACVLQDCDPAKAIAVARRCEQEMRRYPFADLGLREPVRLSFGISDATRERTFSVKDLLRQADTAMYASKRPGSQSIRVYEEHMADDAEAILSASANEAVYRAIEHGEGVCMHYQPVFDRKHQKISYYETLLRLEHGGRLIYPNEIFPVVESRHLELEVDRAVVAKVLSDLEAGLVPPGTGASINLSAASIVHDDVIYWLEPLRGFLDNHKIVIEVTETSLIRQMEAASEHLTILRGMGFLVALDDFGSGYSSLRYLTSMPVDIIKFDISLVQALGNPAQRRLVQHLVDLIVDAGQQVVAEGIEDDTMLQRVEAVGFDFVQGYLLGRPAALPVAETQVDRQRSAV